MYYYIFEPIKKSTDRRQQEKIKRVLVEIGLAGETVNPSPARTIDELLAIGIEKGYSTIVAVGTDSHLNRVFSSLVNLIHPGSDLSHKIVLGFVPLSPSPQLLEVLGYGEDLATSLMNLKYRKIKDFDVVTIEPNKHFLTGVQLSVAKPLKLVGEIDGYRLEAMITDLLLDSRLRLKLYNYALRPRWWRRSIAWLFGIPTQTVNINESLIPCRWLRLETPGFATPLALDNEIIAKTPIFASIKEGGVKIIDTRQSWRYN